MKKKRGRKRKRRRHPKMGSKRIPGIDNSESDVLSDAEEKFGFQTGSDYTFQDFQKVACNFKESYFGIGNAIVEEIAGQNADEQKKKWEPSIEDIEGEYWRIIEQPTDEVKVFTTNILVDFLVIF